MPEYVTNNAILSPERISFYDSGSNKTKKSERFTSRKII